MQICLIGFISLMLLNTVLGFVIIRQRLQIIALRDDLKIIKAESSSTQTSTSESQS